MNRIKLFLSHASEDQPDFARPLAEALRDEFDVWYSEYVLRMGDPLRAKIDEGLRSCDYGIVVLSHPFFAKKWPQAELDGLFQLETSERKIILPIWKGITEEEVKGYSPILASRYGVQASSGVSRVVQEIRAAVGLVDRAKEISRPTWKDELIKLDADVAHKKKASEFWHSSDAVHAAAKLADEIMREARAIAEDLREKLSTIPLRLPPLKNPKEYLNQNQHYFTLHGPDRLDLHIHFSNPIVNSLDDSELKVGVVRARDEWKQESKSTFLRDFRFKPSIDREMKINWISEGRLFASNRELLDFAFEQFGAVLKGFVDAKAR